MHYSLKIKIRDLDQIESIVEQDITDVEAKRIVGGTVIGEIRVCAPDDYYCLMNVPPIPDDPLPPCSIANLAEIASKFLLTKSSINVLTQKSDLSLDLSKSVLKNQPI